MANQRNTNRQSATNTIKLCTINICGISNRSQFALNKYIDTEQIDLLFVQETDTTETKKLELNNMSFICDTNKAANRGAALYARDKYSITKLEEISKISKHIDSCWGLVIIRNKRFIIGNVYAKLKYKSAIGEVMKMLKAAEKRKGELKPVESYCQETLMLDINPGGTPLTMIMESSLWSHSTIHSIPSA